MKKIVAFILMLCMVLPLAACGKGEITMQKIYNAGLNKTMLKKHKSVSIQDTMDGEPYFDSYITKDYIYNYYKDTEWADFLTDDTYYDWYNDEYARVILVCPDGLEDVSSYREKNFSSLLLTPETMDETIESITETDGRITVVSNYEKEAPENEEEIIVTSGRYEYVLDAKKRELISTSGNYVYDDGESHSFATKISYDVEAPEMIEAFLAYDNQKDDLRTITVITNPGTDKEVSQSVKVPKGLYISFYKAVDYDLTYELYNDAACTDVYDDFENTDSDLTVYVQWTENAE